VSTGRPSTVATPSGGAPTNWLIRLTISRTGAEAGASIVVSSQLARAGVTTVIVVRTQSPAHAVTQPGLAAFRSLPPAEVRV
jgi:hypothetical protein